MNEQFNGATFFHVPVNFRLVIFYDISYKVNINLNGKNKQIYVNNRKLNYNQKILPSKSYSK